MVMAGDPVFVATFINYEKQLGDTILFKFVPE